MKNILFGICIIFIFSTFNAYAMCDLDIIPQINIENVTINSNETIITFSNTNEVSGYFQFKIFLTDNTLIYTSYIYGTFANQRCTVSIDGALN